MGYMNKNMIRRAGLISALLALTLGLSACGGGASTETNPVTSNSSSGGRANYDGPAPASADVQAFKLNLWDNISGTNRCGQCHGTGDQSPTFARNDNINTAYSLAQTIVDLGSPSQSLMVTKVEGGHNCWLASDAACGTILQGWIAAWAAENGDTSGGTTIELIPPPIRPVGDTKTFPDDATLFAATVHPVLTQYCQGCHAEDAAIPQSPFFANNDPSTAYAAARSKITLDDDPDDGIDATAESRFVVRLRDEFHNCWSNCADDAQTMHNAILAFSNGIAVTTVDPSLVTSKALSLYDGTVASGGNRYDANVIAKYEFTTGTGLTAYDTSGVDPALDLTLSGDVRWAGGWGIEIVNGKAQGSTASSSKLHDLITATGEYTIETWAIPANVTQEDAHIVSYSGGNTVRNFTLAQRLYSYEAFHRSSTTDGNGSPALATADADEDLQAALQHVVITYDPINGRQTYVNGVHTGDVDPTPAGNLNDWDDTFAFVLGNEVSSQRLWQGTLRMVAIHNRALTPNQILQNFDAGVGQKYFLLFYVGDVDGVPEGSYVMFEVAIFDTYSYLFNRPVFINLNDNVIPDGIDVEGIRLGINGEEATVGQAFINVDAQINSTDYQPSTGQLLSDIGTIIPLEKGAQYDLFFVTFERLGNETNVFAEGEFSAPIPTYNNASTPDIGIKTFEEISASMSRVTGVSMQDSDVVATYTTIKQQLPTSENVGGFLASHQVGVAQLAIEYCNALVDDTTLRASYFPGFNFSAAANVAFDTQGERDLVLDPLLDNMMSTGLSSQPNRADVKAELESLINNLTACGGGCAADRTETVVKATCAALLGSAVTLVQ